MTAAFNKYFMWSLICIIIMQLAYEDAVNCRSVPNNLLEDGGARLKRQFDLTFAAEHDDKNDETELVLEAIANLWHSADGNTQIEGSAKVVHQSHSFHDGNNHYSGRLRLHHDYNTNKKDTNNIKTCLDLSSMC